MNSIAEQIVEIGRMLFERNLTDTGGGNITVREGDLMYCSPRYAGTVFHWDLKPEDIVVGSVLTDELVEHPRFTREGLSHIAIYRHFPTVKAVIHAHPRNILPFCAMEKPIPPVLRTNEKYGTVGFIPHAPNYSQEQADYIVESFKGKEELMQRSAAAVLMPKHGIILAGAKLNEVFSALERIDVNAWCVIAGKLIS